MVCDRKFCFLEFDCLGGRFRERFYILVLASVLMGCEVQDVLGAVSVILVSIESLSVAHVRLPCSFVGSASVAECFQRP